MKRINRRIFTAEFKHEAIKLVTEQALLFAQASNKLDIVTNSLRTWMDQNVTRSLYDAGRYYRGDIGEQTEGTCAATEHCYMKVAQMYNSATAKQAIMIFPYRVKTALAWRVLCQFVTDCNSICLA